jgi:hypothetical protein
MDLVEFFYDLRCPFIDFQTSDKQNPIPIACVLSLLPSQITTYTVPPMEPKA